MQAHLTLFCLVALAGLGSLSGCKQQAPPEQKPPQTPSIVWSPDRKLTWDDFKRKPKEGTGLDAESTVYIESSTPIECKNGKVVYNVRAVFEPDESWVDPTKKSDALLAHEQGHFDLAELYARKLRKKLSELASLCEDKKKFDEAVKTALRQNQDDFLKAQEKYDTDTDHGDDADKQKQAADDIKKGLDDLKDFK